jgi:acetyltransferase-like isoleucine patch superfamily enzyme
MMPQQKISKPVLRKAGVKNVKTGKGVSIIQPCNLYGCSIGNNSFVGPFTEIQKGVVIGSNCRIQSHSFICELVTIGNDCFIGHGVMFINDTFAEGKPALGTISLWKKTTVGNHVSIGSNATILPVTICDGAVIGAGAVVTKDIKVKGVYAGNPAKLLRKLK